MDLKEESKTERVAGKLAICSFENIQIKKTVILKGLSSKFYVTLDSQPRIQGGGDRFCVHFDVTFLDC